MSQYETEGFKWSEYYQHIIKKFIMNKSAVRRALTTLKKNGVITSTFLKGKGNESACIKVIVPSDLIQPKKRVYIRKTKTKKDYTTDGGVSN